jgi:serine kinase of HPr protein (carbohydrate metabolism regulator)
LFYHHLAGSGHMTTAIHATCIVIRHQGVLITGPSGVGKTSLALRLMGLADRQGLFSALVGDDRVLLSPAGTRLIARPHPAIAGLIERRGSGVIPCVFERSAVVGLVIELSQGPVARMPDTKNLTIGLAGVTLPRILCSLVEDDPARVALTLAA